MRLSAGLAALLALIGVLSVANPAPASELAVIAHSGRVLEVLPEDGRALVRTDTDERLAISARLDGGLTTGEIGLRGITIVALPGLIPHGGSASGNREIRLAWLSDPTERYRHGVLGDRLEAAALRIRLRNGAEFVLEAGNDAVFEDLTPRLADLDGNGEDEIIVVKSYLDRGAALAVIGLRASGLEILDETPPIGRRNRWLNPVGAADFDGDGRMEIAYVETPHIGGRLMIWEWRGGALHREHALTGFSNHAIGSTELGLSAIADVDGDGLMDIAVPGRYRDRMRLIGFAGGEPEELADIALDGTVATAIAPVGGHLVFGLEDGRLMALRMPRP